MLFKSRKTNPAPPGRQPAARTVSGGWRPAGPTPVLSNQPRRRPGTEDITRQRPAPTQTNQPFSYYAARSQSEVRLGRESAQSKPLRRLPGRLHRLKRHAGWLAAGLVMTGFLLYQLQLSTTPKVVTLAASSQTPYLQEASVYQQAAHDLLNGSAVNRNKLTVDTTMVANRLEQQFPELAEASITLPIFGDQPILYVRPAKPALVLAALNGPFIIDENGRALAQVTSANSPDQLKIPSVTDQTQATVKLGSQVLPSTVTAFIANVRTQYERQQLTVQSMTLPASGGELDVYLAGQPYYVKFNIHDLRDNEDMQQIGTSLAVIKRLQQGGEKPAQYIDARVPGRAYYL